MIREETVFILGAGASRHLGYPLGSDLWKKIVEQLSPVKDLGNISKEESVKEKERKKNKEFLIRQNFSEQDIQEFCNTLSEYHPYTLDEFLENNQKYSELAKFAIAQVLIPHEDGEILMKQQNWYQKLFEAMKTTVDQFHENRVTFVSFNYDRSLEQYLFQKLQLSQVGKEDECAEALKQFKFIHVYGKLGDLPWQSHEGRPYQNQRTYNLDELKKAANGIMTTTEQQNLGILDDVFISAKKILFLGFGFDRFNLEKLNLLPWIDGTKSIIGTAFKLESDKKRRTVEYFKEKNYDIVLREGIDVLNFLLDVNLS